ncbi:hypothetical protein VMCG_00113 [Cytospora schulzeri]|uniref:Uncharacterized protein n=1 Tax=Cytospora schulzeri TaxID=448051 RepID=A0A423X9W5_9PEZI|nr:hypothetical protein VMCG_00113 [Valsa malicola]
MGLSKQSTPTCATPVIDKKKIDTSRTGIVVVAFGTLFLVSQLCLIIWILARPHAFSRRKVLRNSTGPSSSTSNSYINANTYDNNSPKARQKLRPSSTWSGAALERQYLDQRGKPGDLDELVASETPSSSPDTDSSSEHSARNGNRDLSIKTAVSALPSRSFRGLLSSHGADPDPELEEFDPRRVWIEMGLMAAVIAKPRSPRSPRLNAVDQAALMEALASDGIDAPSHTAAVVEDAEALASGFDDPLGVNRRLASTKKNADTVISPSGSELRGRSV